MAPPDAFFFLIHIFDYLDNDGARDADSDVVPKILLRFFDRPTASAVHALSWL